MEHEELYRESDGLVKLMAVTDAGNQKILKCNMTLKSIQKAFENRRFDVALECCDMLRELLTSALKAEEV